MAGMADTAGHYSLSLSLNHEGLAPGAHLWKGTGAKQHQLSTRIGHKDPAKARRPQALAKSG